MLPGCKFWDLQCKVRTSDWILKWKTFRQWNSPLKRFCNSKFLRMNWRFFSIRTTKIRTFCFSTKKNVVRVVFKYKFYFKNSAKLILKNPLQSPVWRFFSWHAFPEIRILFFWPHERTSLNGGKLKLLWNLHKVDTIGVWKKCLF